MKFLGRSLLLALAFVATLGSISLAQFGGPGVNSQYSGIWNFVWESSTSKPTYYATSAPFAAASSGEIIFTINGSSTKTVRVRRFIVSGISTLPIAEPLYVNKYSSATISTGTSVNLTEVPVDSNYTAATAYVENFTANPTLPTLVGELMAPYLQTFAGNTTAANAPLVIEMGRLGAAATLRSATEALALSLAHVTTGMTLTIAVEWTEE